MAYTLLRNVGMCFYAESWQHYSTNVVTGSRVQQLERQVDLQLPAHGREDELDPEGVGDDDPEKVARVAGLGQGRAGQVGLVADLQGRGSQNLGF